MKSKKKAKNNYKVVAGFVSLIAVVAVVGVIGIGKAQMQKSGVAELVELANSLGGNSEAFQAGIAYLTGNGVVENFTAGASGDLNLSSFTAKAMQTDGITIDGPSYFTSDITAGIVTTGGGDYNSTTTDAATYTVVQAEIDSYSYLDFDHTGAANITYTMPATSTMIAILPEVGSTRTWTIHNASTTAVLTLAAGAGMNLLGIDTNVDTIAADGWATLECIQSVYVSALNENISCLMAEYVVAD